MNGNARLILSKSFLNTNCRHLLVRRAKRKQNIGSLTNFRLSILKLLYSKAFPHFS